MARDTVCRGSKQPRFREGRDKAWRVRLEHESRCWVEGMRKKLELGRWQSRGSRNREQPLSWAVWIPGWEEPPLPRQELGFEIQSSCYPPGRVDKLLFVRTLLILARKLHWEREAIASCGTRQVYGWRAR